MQQLKRKFKGFKEELTLSLTYLRSDPDAGGDGSYCVGIVANTYCNTIPFLLEMEKVLQESIPFPYNQIGDSTISECKWAPRDHSYKMEVRMHIKPIGPTSPDPDMWPEWWKAN